MTRLAGKVAIISGAARGQGAAEARLFAREGAKVVLGDVLIDEARALADEINRETGLAMALACRLDVSKAADWLTIVGQAENQFGGLDILVNNAAILAVADIETSDEEEWETVISVNQTGTWLGMKAAVPAMRRRGGGSIINISSIGGLVGTPDYAAYHAAKGAVRMLSKHGAAAYAKDGIRVNTVYPGPIMTSMIGTLNDEQYRASVETTLLRRIGKPEEVASAVLFLASDEASYVTGADLAVDGGYTAV